MKIKCIFQYIVDNNHWMLHQPDDHLFFEKEIDIIEPIKESIIIDENQFTFMYSYEGKENVYLCKKRSPWQDLYYIDYGKRKREYLTKTGWKEILA